jgi:type II secretory pathway component PulF
MKMFSFIENIFIDKDKVESNFNALSKWYRQHTFSTKDRMEFYESLAFLLDNEKTLEVALEEMRSVATDFGKRSHHTNLLLTDCIDAIGDGKSIEQALIGWVPLQETSIIGAGILEGKIPEALKRAASIIEGKQEMQSSLIGAMLYPSFLFSIIIAMMYMVNDKFIPKLSRILPMEKWTGALWVLGNLSKGVIENGLLWILILIFVVSWVYWSLNNLTGRSRRFLDSIEVSPWGLYKIFHGVSFLLNMSALMRGNVPTLNALNKLNENASPWLQERINAIKKPFKQGCNLGLAMKESGYIFPSRDCINHLSLIASNSGSEMLIESYALRWLALSIKKVKKIAIYLGAFSFVLVFSYMLLLLLSVNQVNTLVGK